jgi:hypothetical protein
MKRRADRGLTCILHTAALTPSGEFCKYLRMMTGHCDPRMMDLLALI